MDALQLQPDYKAYVRRGFARAAGTYDAAASLHRRVADRVLARLAPLAGRPRVCLDVGCGTGILTALLLRLRPDAIIGVDLSGEMCARTLARLRAVAGPAAPAVSARVGDAEALPIASDTVDLLVSSYALQWTSRPEAALAEWARVTRPGGLIALAAPVGGSLPELAHALETALGARGRALLHHFPDAARVRETLAAAGVVEASFSLETDAMSAGTARDLFRQLRSLGAQTAGRARWRLGPSAALAVLGAYEARANAGNVVASFRTMTYIGRISKGGS